MTTSPEATNWLTIYLDEHACSPYDLYMARGAVLHEIQRLIAAQDGDWPTVAVQRYRRLNRRLDWIQHRYAGNPLL